MKKNLNTVGIESKLHINFAKPELFIFFPLKHKA